MRLLIAILVFLYAPAVWSCETITQILLPGSNPTPAEWVKSAAQKYSLCVTSISTLTENNGKIDRLHKRNHRDTVILLPPDLAERKKIEIVYWFHGLTGFSQRTFQTRLIPQWSRVLKETSHRPIIVVAEMPWSHFTRTQWKRQGKVWKKKDQFFLYTQEVEKIISKSLSKNSIDFERIIIGHSAGGSAIASSAALGGLCKSKPKAVIFSDATYGSWFSRSWKGCLRDYKSAHNVRVMVLNVRKGKPWLAFQKWSKWRKKQALKVESPVLLGKWRHSRVGDNALLLYYDYFPDFVYRSL